MRLVHMRRFGLKCLDLDDVGGSRTGTEGGLS